MSVVSRLQDFPRLESSAGALLLGAAPLGIALGLFFGKQIGVFCATSLAVKSGLAHLPESVNWT